METFGATHVRVDWLRRVVLAVGALLLACSDAAEPGAVPSYVDCVHTTTDDPGRRDTDTLPVGACRPSEPACNLVLREPCPCKSQVPRAFYTCTCKSGAWSCELVSLDAGICAIAMDGSCIYGEYDAATD